MARIDIVSLWVHVTKDRRDTKPLQRMRGSDKRKGRHNYFTRQAEGSDRDLQAHGSIASGDAMAHSEISGNPLFEFLQAGTIIR